MIIKDFFQFAANDFYKPFNALKTKNHCPVIKIGLNLGSIRARRFSIKRRLSRRKGQFTSDIYCLCPRYIWEQIPLNGLRNRRLWIVKDIWFFRLNRFSTQNFRENINFSSKSKFAWFIVSSVISLGFMANIKIK